MEEDLDILAGLDIGTNTTKIAIAQYSSSLNTLNLIALESIPSAGVNKGVVNNINAVADKMQILINSITKNYSIELNTINLAIKDPNIKQLQHKFVITRNPGQAISVGDIDRLINDAYELAVLPGRSILNAAPIYYNLDNETGIINPVGRMATHIEAYFNIILGETFVLHNLSKCINKVNLNINEVIFSPLASAEACLVNEEREAGAILVNIGSETTEISIFQENVLSYINVIPIGSNLITKDIAEALQILPKQAESIKIEYGSALATSNADIPIPVAGLRGDIFKTIPSRDLNYIIQIRSEEILEYIIAEIKNAGISSKLLGGIILVGGGAKTKNIDILARHMFNTPVRIGNPSEHINGPYKDKMIDPIFATAIGLTVNYKNNIKNQEAVFKSLGTVKKKTSNWFGKIIKKTLISDLLNNDTNDKDFIK
ncbi:MAG: cell division protein FtsA [Solitalea-like symbiont of Acarus siro]